MKVAVTAAAGGVQAAVDDRFGRAPFFVIADSERDEVRSVENRAANSPQGAGMSAVQLLVDQGVQAVLTSNVGPNAARALRAAGIPVYQPSGSTVAEALQAFRGGQVRRVIDATVGAHHGQEKTVSSDAAAGRKPGGKHSPGAVLAVATEGDLVAPHFGRCPHYTIVHLDGGGAERRQVIPNPGHQPGFLPKYLASKGVTAVMAGGMGPRAAKLFQEQGVIVLTGVTGRVDEAVEAFKTGRLRCGPSSCEHL